MRVQYDSYKDSEAPWAGDIPSGWQTYPFFALAKANETKNTGLVEQNLLSLSYGRIIQKDINTKFGLLPESFETYQIVSPGQIVFRLTDLQNDKVSLRSALVKDRGIITSAYLAVKFEKLVPAYADYLMRAYDKQMVFYELGGGVRQSAKYDDLKWMPVIVPPTDDQKAIANFLDEKTAQIDELIKKKKSLLELITEKRIALITQAVTKGLDPTVPMKPSGIEWLGEVPRSWEVNRLKHKVRIERGKFSHRPRNAPHLYDGKYPFIQTGDISKTGKYITQWKQTLSEEGKIVSRKFGRGTIVMAIAANVGDVAILDFDAYAPDSIVGFFPEKRIDNNFVFYSLISSIAQLEAATVTNTQGNLNVERIGETYVCVPPLQIQESISGQLDELQRRNLETEKKIAGAIDKLKEYRSALVTNAVTGKIKVT